MKTSVDIQLHLDSTHTILTKFHAAAGSYNNYRRIYPRFSRLQGKKRPRFVPTPEVLRVKNKLPSFWPVNRQIAFGQIGSGSGFGST